MTDFLRWIRESSNDSAKKLDLMMQDNASTRKQPAVVTGSLFSDDAVLRNLVTKQIRQVLLVSKVAGAYDSKNDRINEPATFLFRDRMDTVTLVDGSGFLQVILKSNRRKTKNHFVNMTTPSIFKAIKLFY